LLRASNGEFAGLHDLVSAEEEQFEYTAIEDITQHRFLSASLYAGFDAASFARTLIVV
jgi:hypothetical protein